MAYVRTKQAAEKLWIRGEIGGKHTSGAKAHVDYIAFRPGINHRPTLKPSFSAACKARTLQKRQAYFPWLRLATSLRIAGKTANPSLPHGKTGKPPIQGIVSGGIGGQKEVQPRGRTPVIEGEEP